MKGYEHFQLKRCLRKLYVRNRCLVEQQVSMLVEEHWLAAVVEAVEEEHWNVK